MVGKYAALATPIRALAAIRFCSAWRMSGRRSSRSEGSPAGNRRQDQLVDGLAARDRTGIAAEQHAQGVFLLGDRLLEGRDGGQGLLVLGLGSG